MPQAATVSHTVPEAQVPRSLVSFEFLHDLLARVVARSPHPDMADPIAIIGLAASIITFIDFGTKIVSAAISLRDSPDGTIPEAEELNLIIQDIRSLSSGIQDKMPAKAMSEDERRILLMVSKCNELSAELMRILDKLKIRDQSWSRTVEAVRVTLQVAWKKKDVESLQRRLRDLERSLRGSLNRALQQ